MIPKTYYDDNPEDRRYIHDYWSWLKEQPQDAWLLWARHANWDNAETIFEFMIETPDCDLALVSWLFWTCGPADHVRNPDYYRPDRLIARIVGNVERGFYRSSELFCDQREIAMAAHQYVKALQHAGGRAPFRLPRVLCGPFPGRRASICARYDEETERGLQEIFHYLNGGLPRSEAEHRQQWTHGGNGWLEVHLALPTVPTDPISAFRDRDDAGYIEALFGKSSDFDAALERHLSGARPRRRWWPFR